MCINYVIVTNHVNWHGKFAVGQGKQGILRCHLRRDFDKTKFSNIEKVMIFVINLRAVHIYTLSVSFNYLPNKYNVCCGIQSNIHRSEKLLIF